MPSTVFEPWHLELMSELRVGRLATVRRDGSPHLVPVCYAFEGGLFWIAVDEKPKRSTQLARLANIEREPRVSLLLDRYDEDWTRLAWLRIDGNARIIAEGRAEPHALEALRRRYSQYREMDLESRPLIKVQPAAFRAWRHSPG